MTVDSNTRTAMKTQSGAASAIARMVPGFITPNHISIGRIIGCLVLVWLEVAGATPWTLTVVAFVVGTSDFIDGIVARERGLITELGAFLDPLGDKLYFLAMLWIIWQRGWLEWYLLVAILVIESHAIWLPLMCIARRSVKGRKLWPPPALKPNWMGKWKMGWLGYSLGVIVLGKAAEVNGIYLFAWWNIWIGLGLGLGAWAVYLWDFARGEYQ